jgi:hypothetical protein
MKKRIFGMLLMGAMVVASMSMFTSCKDYDDDINKNAADITALKAELANLRTQLASDLSAATASLNTAIAAKADAKTVTDLAGQVSDLNTALAGKADAKAVTDLAAEVAGLKAKIDAIDLSGYATTESLSGYATAAKAEELAGLIAALTGKVDGLADAAKVAAVEKNLEIQAKALENLTKQVEELSKKGYDDTAIKKEISDLQAAIKSFAKSSDVTTLTKTVNDLSDKINKSGIEKINVLEVLVNKKLTSLVLKPNFYWEGIEGIEVPFISQTPVFVEKGEYKFKYQLTNAPAGSGVVDVKVAKHMGWLNTDASYVNRELSIYVNAPVKAHHETWPATAAEIAKVKKVDIAYGAVAQYHVNPSAADLEGATIGFYDHSAPTYTRGDAAPSIKPVAKEATFAKDGKYNKFANGILTVPFTVDYAQVLKYFIGWTKSQTNNWEGLAGAAKESWFANAGNDDKDNDTWAYNGNLPYVSLQVTTPANEKKGISEAFSVNSDYAVVVPARYTIVALADKAPEKTLDLTTFVVPSDAANTAKPEHQIRANHLYETVGYDDNGVRATDATLANQKWNVNTAYGAIPMPATHSVKYDGTIDLMDFVETHYDYTTFAQYGKSTTDQTMSEELMAQLGLSYKFTVIDYWIGASATSESAHIQQSDGKAKGSLFTPRSVTEDGATIKDKPATREVVDREPLVRVDLVDANGNIIRYGYIKIRIVADKATVSDLEVSININKDFYMNCGDEGQITWSQVENLILSKLGSAGMTKQEFEKNYKLDVYGDYKFMPYIDHTKITGDTDNDGPLSTKSWQAKRYVKDGTAYKPAIDGDKVECDDDSIAKWTNTNNHFGEIWYTPHDNSTEGHNWDEQTNVLIWNLYPGDGTAMPAYRTTYVAGAMAKTQAGGMTKAKYHALRTAVGIDYNNHKSTKALSTVVRFINKTTGASVYVTLIIPETKIEFNWGEIANKDWSHWWKINTQNFGVEQATSPYWDEFDTHMNTPVPAYVGYKWLTVNDFKQDLRDYWHDPAEMIQMKGTAGKYSNFTATAPGVVPTTDFIFVTPKDKLNSDGVSAAADGTWVVTGASGTKWTLKITADGKKIQAVKKGTAVYGPEDVCELRANPEDGKTSVLYYHGLENAANLYPAATDLVNKSGRYDETGAKRFGAGTAMGEQADAQYLAKNVDETFTAYIKINVTHYCYDPLISKQYFNVRVLRPINVAGKEKKIKDIPNVMQKISLRDLVDIVDYRDIPVVGRYAAAQAAANNAFGIASPKWDDVSNGVMTGTGTVKVQNAGVPYEFYKVSDLAVMYSEILSDHQAPYAFREAGALRTASAIQAALAAGNVKAVKDIPSLRGGLEGKDYTVATNPRVLSLWSNDADHSLKVENTWAIAQLVDMTQTDTHSRGIGKIEYTNNSGITQLFHIYVPIAVKYNWGNIKKDNAFGKPAKLDNNYTQKVWAVITVDPSYLGE